MDFEKISRKKLSSSTSRRTNSELPKLFLGDRGFLKRYGSRFKMKDIYFAMNYARQCGDIGLSAGDMNCLKAINLVKSNNDDAPAFIYHTQFLIRSSPLGVKKNEIMATLYHFLPKEILRKFKNDPFIGIAYSYYSKYKSYNKKQLSQICLNTIRIHRDLKIINNMKPEIVTLGGDWFDFLIAVKNYKLAREIINIYRDICDKKNIRLALFTYLGPVLLSPSSRLLPPRLFDLLMLPVNLCHYGMVPSEKGLFKWAKQMNKPILAMHALALGDIPLEPGLFYVFNNPQVATAVIGASTQSHIKLLINSYNLLFQCQ